MRGAPIRPLGAGVGSWVAPTAYLLGAGWFFATCIILGIVLGRWADARTDLEPLFTLIGVGLGLATALVGGYKMLAPFMERFGDESNGGNEE